MRICHFCTTSVDGHYFEDMAHGLNGLGAETVFGTLVDADPPGWWESAPESRYFSLKAAQRRQFGVAVARLAHILTRRRVDVLQTHLFEAGLVGVAAGRLAGVPLVIVTRHHLDYNQMLGARFHVALDRATTRFADHVVVPAAAVREHMVTRERADARKIDVIHLGVNLKTFAPRPTARQEIRDEFGLADSFVVGSVGRIEPQKGLSTLIAAAGRLSTDISNLRVLIVGDHPDPTHRRALVCEVESLGLRDRVIFTGYRQDVAACMQAMDVLAHPSRTEALPQVLIEAMAVGTPVVATCVGGIPEIVQNGETGILVPPSDTDALVSAITRVHRGDDLRERFSRASIRSARLRFDSSTMVERHLECYERLLGRTSFGTESPRWN